MPKSNSSNRMPNRAFMKVYITANMDENLSLNNILLSLFRCVDGKTNRIELSAKKKKEIARKCRVKLETIDIYLNRFIHDDILQKTGTGSYLLNPDRFNKGYGMAPVAAEYQAIKQATEVERQANKIKYGLDHIKRKSKGVVDIRRLNDGNG